MQNIIYEIDTKLKTLYIMNIPIPKIEFHDVKFMHFAPVREIIVSLDYYISYSARFIYVIHAITVSY